MIIKAKSIVKMSFFGLLACVWLIPSAYAAEGMEKIASQHSVTETLDKLESNLTAKGMTIFARVNHSEGAASINKQLPDTQLLIFGNPKIGTPLMQCQHSIALDLPQKMLAWQEADGTVWLGYNEPLYLAQRHGIDMDNPCYPILEKVSKALSNFAKTAAK